MGMKLVIRQMKKEDYPKVSEIYSEGIRTNMATFQREVPSYENWDKGHLEIGRLVTVNQEGEILGWCALSPTSNREVYKGVVEVSIYISEKHRGEKVGTTLLNALIDESEQAGIWTLQSGIFEINEASIALHKKCDFRIVGFREKIGCDIEGIWQNTVLMERRSKIVGR